jgi:hypothetical protein
MIKRRAFLNLGLNLSRLCLTAAYTPLIVGASIGLNTQTALASAPKKKAGGKAYTQLPMIVLSTKSQKSKRGTLSIETGIYAEDPKLVDFIVLHQPRLIDAFISSLQTYAQTLTNTSVANTDYMTTLLQAATDRVIGKKGAKVLLGTVVLN